MKNGGRNLQNCLFGPGDGIRVDEAMAWGCGLLTLKLDIVSLSALSPRTRKAGYRPAPGAVQSSLETRCNALLFECETRWKNPKPFICWLFPLPLTFNT